VIIRADVSARIRAPITTPKSPDAKNPNTAPTTGSIKRSPHTLLVHESLPSLTSFMALPASSSSDSHDSGTSAHTQTADARADRQTANARTPSAPTGCSLGQGLPALLPCASRDPWCRSQPHASLPSRAVRGRRQGSLPPFS